MIATDAHTWWARIYLSGPVDVVKQAIREECWREGLCVTVDQTLFIYTGGEEQGCVVGLVNYPRFPSPPNALEARAIEVANLLLKATFQRSALVVMPTLTVWIHQTEGGSAR